MKDQLPSMPLKSLNFSWISLSTFSISSINKFLWVTLISEFLLRNFNKYRKLCHSLQFKFPFGIIKNFPINTKVGLVFFCTIENGLAFRNISSILKTLFHFVIPYFVINNISPSTITIIPTTYSKENILLKKISDVIINIIK